MHLNPNEVRPKPDATTETQSRTPDGQRIVYLASSESGDTMQRARIRTIAAIAASVVVAAGLCRSAIHAEDAKRAPTFEVDPFWPKPLPNHWVTGSTIGLSVDAQDNVWTIHRPNTVEDNFKAADIKVGDAEAKTTKRSRAPVGAQASGSRRSARAARSRRRCSSTTRPAIW